MVKKPRPLFLIPGSILAMALLFSACAKNVHDDFFENERLAGRMPSGEEEFDNKSHNAYPAPELVPPRAPELVGKDVKEYTSPGDETLMLISFKLYGDYRLWRKIAKLNPNLALSQGVKKGTVLRYYQRQGEFTWPPAGNPYLVKSGDTLVKISRKIYQTYRQWKELWRNNRQMILNPDLIFAGFTLYYLPKVAQATVDVIKRIKGEEPAAMVADDGSEKERKGQARAKGREEEASPAAERPYFSNEGQVNKPAHLFPAKEYKDYLGLGAGVGSTFVGLEQSGALGGINGNGRVNSFTLFSQIEFGPVDMHLQHSFQEFSAAYEVQNTSKKNSEQMNRTVFTGGYNKWNLGFQINQLPLARVAVNNIQFTNFTVMSLMGGYRGHIRDTSFLGKSYDLFLDFLLEYPILISSTLVPITIKGVTGYGGSLGATLKRSLYAGQNHALNLGLQGFLHYVTYEYDVTWDVNSGKSKTSDKEFTSSIISDFTF